MTDSTARMLRPFGSAALQEAYVPRLTTLQYERLRQGTQWMTEKAGGSDVGALTTVARRDGDGTWRLWGDTWFCSDANTDMAVAVFAHTGGPEVLTLSDVPAHPWGHAPSAEGIADAQP